MLPIRTVGAFLIGVPALEIVKNGVRWAIRHTVVLAIVLAVVVFVLIHARVTIGARPFCCGGGSIKGS